MNVISGGVNIAKKCVLFVKTNLIYLCILDMREFNSPHFYEDLLSTASFNGDDLQEIPLYSRKNERKRQLNHTFMLVCFLTITLRFKSPTPILLQEISLKNI